jgi:predicted nucleotidyltransferase component of viral defense system
MTDPRDGSARSVQARLARHARGIGVDPNLVLTRFAVERFLYRLSRSPYAEQFILKGALLMLIWLGEGLRPTSDADLLGFGELSDDALASIVKTVCTMPVEPDAVEFDRKSVRVEAIREEAAYGGRRVKLNARVGEARLTVQLDIGFGDVVTPAAEWLDYPVLLDLPAPRLRAYPRESVIAEKLHAMVVLGTRNSRMKDYFDLDALAREGAVEAARLSEAIAATFARRGTVIPEGVLPGLAGEFAEDDSKQAQWKAYLTRNRLEGRSLPETIAEVRGFLEEPMKLARELMKDQR